MVDDEQYAELIGSERPDRAKALARKMIDAYEESILRFRHVLDALEKAEELWKKHWQYGNMDDPVLNEMFKMSRELASGVAPLAEALEVKIIAWQEELVARRAILNGGANGQKQS